MNTLNWRLFIIDTKLTIYASLEHANREIMNYHFKKIVAFVFCHMPACLPACRPLDNGIRTDDIIIDFSKASNLVPHDQLLRKIVVSGVNSRVVVWIREFLLGLYTKS
jgi:hypothetical protein